MSEVHIIAKGSGHEDAPGEGETWGVNDIILRRDQLSMCFHMHDMDWIRRKEWSALKLIIEKAKKFSIPIMTTKVYDWIPTSVAFPIDDIVNKFKANYYGSSIDYMITLAMYWGIYGTGERDFDTINIFGCNMVLKGEYAQQKPSLEFWIGMAMGLGYKVNIIAGKHSAILKTYDKKMYGYNIDQFKP